MIDNNNNKTPVFNPEEIIKKEARSTNNIFLGQIQQINLDNIIVERGTVEKEKERYYFPKNLFERYDGHDVWFRITEEQAKQYKKRE
jgi:hypothetical protein